MRHHVASLVPLLALAIGSLAVAAQEATPAAAPVPFAGEAYVGLADDGATFVAVVVAEGDPGTDREARAYLCDGQHVNLWLAGTTDGDALALRLHGAADFQATLGPRGVAGTAALADHSVLAFEARPVEGIAGLYEVVVGEDGRFQGSAAGGQRLEAVVAGALPDGTLLVAGVVALPGGGARPVAAFATADAAGELRWIVLNDGRVAGGPRLAAGATGPPQGAGFITPINSAVPRPGGFFIDPTTGQ